MDAKINLSKVQTGLILIIMSLDWVQLTKLLTYLVRLRAAPEEDMRYMEIEDDSLQAIMLLVRLHKDDSNFVFNITRNTYLLIGEKAHLSEDHRPRSWQRVKADLELPLEDIIKRDGIDTSQDKSEELDSSDSKPFPRLTREELDDEMDQYWLERTGRPAEACTDRTDMTKRPEEVRNKTEGFYARQARASRFKE